MPKVLEEANLSGELRLSGRKLKDFPKTAAKYNLSDTVIAGNKSSFVHSFVLSIFNLGFLWCVCVECVREREEAKNVVPFWPDIKLLFFILKRKRRKKKHGGSCTAAVFTNGRTHTRIRSLYAMTINKKWTKQRTN